MNFLRQLRGSKLNLVDNRILLGVFCIFYYFLQASPAYAWGPAVHYQLGLKFIELGIGGAILGEVIRENKKHFLYGNVIADIVAGKSKIDFPDSSHNWAITAELNRNATTTAQKVFSLGFQLHLAADTVAHNDFIADNLSRTKFPRNIDHAYWEFKAENKISPDIRRELNQLKNWNLKETDRLVEKTISDTVFPFFVNWKLLEGLLGLSAHDNWHKLNDRWQKLSRYKLSESNFQSYFDESLKRMQWCCGPRKQKDKIYRLDPTGEHDKLPASKQVTDKLHHNNLSEVVAG